ncbi:35387_t:CDS:1, partial [Gigaspora margarita]
VLKEWFEGLISEEESVEELESLFETEELKETETLSFNKLLTDLKYLADDPMEKWKLVNLFDFKFLTPLSIKNLIKIQDDSR